MSHFEKENCFFYVFVYGIIIATILLLICFLFAIKEPKRNTSKAVILLRGEIIECEIEDYEIIHSLCGDMAKIISKDGKTYYTNSFKIIEED